MPLPPPPPACIVIGDSIAVGTAGALASEGLRCEVHARVGASSAEMLRTFTDGGHRARAVIALGSNDAGNPNLLRNLVALRQRVRATRGHATTSGNVPSKASCNSRAISGFRRSLWLM